MKYLTNPDRRGGATMARKKRRTAAQRRATARLIAHNKARRRATKRTSAAPARARTTHRGAGGSMAKRRRRRSTARKTVRRRSTTARRRTHTRRRRRTGGAITMRPVRGRVYRRNPSFGGILGSVVETAKDAGATLVGGAAARVISGYIPIQQQGLVGVAVQTAVAIGLRMIAGKVVNRDLARFVGAGAMQVPLKNLITTFVPQAGAFLGDYDGVGAYLPEAGVGAYLEPGVGDYENQQVGSYVEVM